MRPVQQNRRMRGRGNNNNRSKGPNPLSRNYESNGPDVKIRGNAQHIAEKYTTLARDAQSSGDRVIAENYLQHAEHYNRIILAAQAQAPVQYQRDDLMIGMIRTMISASRTRATTATSNGNEPGSPGTPGSAGFARIARTVQTTVIARTVQTAVIGRNVRTAVIGRNVSFIKQSMAAGHSPSSRVLLPK